MLTTYYGLVRYDISQVMQQKTHAKVAAGGDDQVLIFQQIRTIIGKIIKHHTHQLNVL